MRFEVLLMCVRELLGLDAIMRQNVLELGVCVGMVDALHLENHLIFLLLLKFAVNVKLDGRAGSPKALFVF